MLSDGPPIGQIIPNGAAVKGEKEEHSEMILPKVVCSSGMPSDRFLEPNQGSLAGDFGVPFLEKGDIPSSGTVVTSGVVDSRLEADVLGRMNSLGGIILGSIGVLAMLVTGVSLSPPTATLVALLAPVPSDAVDRLGGGFTFLRTIILPASLRLAFAILATVGSSSGLTTAVAFLFGAITGKVVAVAEETAAFGLVGSFAHVGQILDKSIGSGADWLTDASGHVNSSSTKGSRGSLAIRGCAGGRPTVAILVYLVSRSKRVQN